MAKKENLDELVKRIATKNLQEREIVEAIEDLRTDVSNQSEEVIAALVEGVKRSITVSKEINESTRETNTSLNDTNTKLNQIDQTLQESNRVNKIATRKLDGLDRLLDRLTNVGAGVQELTTTNKKGLNVVEQAIKGLPKPYSLKELESSVTGIEKAVRNFRFPTDPKNPVAVRLSDGKEFVEQLTQAAQKVFLTGGGGISVPTTRVSGSNTEGVVVVNPDGTLINGSYDSYQHEPISFSAGNNNVVVNAVLGKQIWVYGIAFTRDVAGTVSFQDEDDNPITGVMSFENTPGMAVPPSGNFAMPIWKVATGKALEVDLVTCSINGWIDYAII